MKPTSMKPTAMKPLKITRPLLTPQNQWGFTLVELLIALAIFGIVIAVASGAIIQYMRVQSDQEAVTSANAKLRRVTELVSQEMRSAVLGGIVGSPYASDADSISFLLMDGGAGYPVLPHSSGNPANFRTDNDLNISSSALTNAELGIDAGDMLLMLNASGNALLFRAGQVDQPSAVDWRIRHPGCDNTIDYTANTLLFKVRTFAVRYDAASDTLFAQEGAGEQTLAWNITDFRIDYIYENGAVTQPNPPGFPARQIGGLTLQRLQIVASTEERSRGKMLVRTYSSQIELSDNKNMMNFGGLTVCP